MRKIFISTIEELDYLQEQIHILKEEIIALNHRILTLESGAKRTVYKTPSVMKHIKGE